MDCENSGTLGLCIYIGGRAICSRWRKVDGCLGYPYNGGGKIDMTFPWRQSSAHFIPTIVFRGSIRAQK